MLWREGIRSPMEPLKLEAGYQQTEPLLMTGNSYLKRSMTSMGLKLPFVVSSVYHGHPCTKNYPFQLSSVSVVDALFCGGSVGSIAGTQSDIAHNVADDVTIQINNV